jgi:cytochrome c oxidase assembly protein subunit 11
LKKIECFCFTVQPLKLDEVKQMPVKFFVDPRLPAGIDTVTISYTFFAQEAS